MVPSSFQFKLQNTIVVIYIYERAAASCKTVIHCAKEVARDYKVSYLASLLNLALNSMAVLLVRHILFNFPFA